MRRRFLLVASAAATAFTATVSLALTAPAASAGTGGGGDEHEPWVVRAAAQRTDSEAFRSLCGEQKEGRPERRTFPLFGRGKGFTAVQDFQRQDADGTVFWGGHDPKNPENTISVSAIGACTEGPVTLSGVITIGFRQYAYQPLAERPGWYELQEIDSPRCRPAGKVSTRSTSRRRSRTSRTTRTSRTGPACGPPRPTTRPPSTSSSPTPRPASP